jgi:ATP-binding cassette subfamily B (MDR/TAP) protein 1
MTLRDNTAIGLAGPGSKRRPQEATRREVIQACQTALLHRFIEDLPDGYDTRLGSGAGGQQQWLAIVRAILRDLTAITLVSRSV